MRTPYARLFTTLLFNFKYLPFQQAKYLPFFIYGPTNIHIGERGWVKLTPTYFTPGMVRVGALKSIIWGDKPWMQTVLIIDGLFEINGSANISNGAIVVVNKGARLSVGHDFHIGPRTKIMCSQSITTGKRASISWESQIFDTDFHYIVRDNSILNNKKKTIIGDFCWIGNRVSIMKGSVLPNYSIVTSNRVVNKDYSNYGEESLLAGLPAKWKISGVKRLYVAPIIDKEIDIYFDKVQNETLSLNSDKATFIKILK